MGNYAWFTGSLVVQRSVPDEKEVKAIVAQLRQAEKLLVRKTRTREKHDFLLFHQEQSLYKAKQKATAIRKANDGETTCEYTTKILLSNIPIHTAVISSEELVKYAHQLSLAGITTPPTGWDPSREKKDANN